MDGNDTPIVEVLDEPDAEIDLSSGDVAWNSATSWNGIRENIQNALNKSSDTYVSDSVESNYVYVHDVNSSQSLVCDSGEYYVAPYKSDKKGNVEVSAKTEWTKVDREWVELSMGFNQDNQLGAEMHLADEKEQVELSDDGLIWKTILREGVWNVRPGPGQRAVDKPLKVIKDGKSDGVAGVISMSELKANFDKGVVEHVTIPTSHKDSVVENTGYVKGLRFETDAKGRTVLKAGHQFTDPDIKKKVLEGSIANVSSGILFNYREKESGSNNSAVLGHVALTNHPWLNDLEPFGVLASENLEVVNFSEDQPEETEAGDEPVGGEEMSEVIVEAPKFLTDLGLSEDEVKSRLERYEILEARDREHNVNEKVRTWEEAKKAPALVAAAKTLLSQASDTEVVLNLSEDGKTVGLSAVEIIDRLVEASPALTLATDPIDEESVQGEKPAADATDENDEAKLSQEQQVLADSLFLTEGYSRDDSIAEAKKRLSESK